MLSDIKSARIDHRALITVAAYNNHFMWWFNSWLRRGGLLLCHFARDVVPSVRHGRRSYWITLFYKSWRTKSAVKLGAIRRLVLTTSLSKFNLLVLWLVHAGRWECKGVLGERWQAKLVYLRVCVIHVFLVTLHRPILTIWYRHFRFLLNLDL